VHGGARAAQPRPARILPGLPSQAGLTRRAPPPQESVMAQLRHNVACPGDAGGCVPRAGAARRAAPRRPA
jgi:hypothetical protein